MHLSVEFHCKINEMQLDDAVAYTREQKESRWKILGNLNFFFNHFPVPISNIICSITYLQYVADHFYYSFLIGLLAPFTGGLSTYVQEPLVVGRRGCTGRDLNEKMLAEVIGP